MISDSEIEKRIQDSYELKNNVLKVVPNPLVTVRTSTYQHAPFIKKCIEGVLMQKTDFPIEFIIGEDYSKDGTREIVFEYAKKYPDIIRVFTADYNVGSKANGRRCIKAARGKYMALCEGDDYWTDPLKLQKQVAFIQKNNNCSLVFHPARCIYNNEIIRIHGPNIKKKYSYFSVNDIIKEPDTLIPTNSMLFRTKYYNSYPKWTTNCPVGDLPLTLILAHYGQVGFINENMSNYRVMTEGSWSNTMLESRKKRKIHDQKIKKMWKEFDVWSNFSYSKLIRKVLLLTYYRILKRELKIRGSNFFNTIKNNY